jgi:hypothetical protein
MEPFRQKACFTVAISASNPLVKWRSHGMRLAPDGVRRASGEPNIALGMDKELKVRVLYGTNRR